MSLRPSTLGLLAAASLLVLSVTGTRAADLDENYGYAEAPQDVPTPELPQTKVEFGTGWYVRGDLGATTGLNIGAGSEPYSAASLSNPSYANASSYTQGVLEGPGTIAPSLTSKSSISPIAVGTLGAGYQFNRWFRADVTADFRQPIKSIYQGQAVPCITGTALVTPQSGPATTENILSASCTPSLSAYLQNFSVLINGYVDIGTWSIFTPYVGAGVGTSFGHAYSASSYYQNNNISYANVSYKDALSGSTFTQNWDRRQSEQYYNFAYALMAGVAIDVFPHTKLDLGYRYLHLGRVVGTELNAQEARAGLRYMIDN